MLIGGGEECGGRACMFAKVRNCLLKLLCASSEEIGGSGLSGEFLASDTEEGWAATGRSREGKIGCWGGRQQQRQR